MGTNGTRHQPRPEHSQSAMESIDCPLCHGEGELTRGEVLNRLGVKEFATVARLSAEEAFRLLQCAYRQDSDLLWSRYQSELTRRLADAEQTYSGRVQELESQLKLAREVTIVETQRIRNELETTIRSEQSSKEDIHRRVEECLSELSRFRSRNVELEAEVSKAAKRGKLEELSFEQEVQTWPGISIGPKLAKNGDFVLAFRDSSGAATEPKLLIDNKNKTTIAESDIRKLVSDAKQRRAAVAVLVASDESQLRQGDRDCRWSQNDGIWLLRTTRQWFRRDLDVLRPVLESMRKQGADFLQTNTVIAEEVRRSLVNLDDVERELAKATKAIDSATMLTGKYRARLRVLCENAMKGMR